MKKIVMMLIGIAATINAMAVDYTAKAKITLTSSDNYSCNLMLSESADYGALTGSVINMEDRQVALYALNGSEKLQIARAADLTNLQLGFKSNGAAGENNYTISVTSVAGTPLVLFDLDNDVQYTLSEGTSFNITLPANAINETRFVINYVAPAPTCTTVREELVVDRYYTICLAKAVTAANGASFWNMSKRGTGVAYLEEAELPLVAGRPYIFQAEATELCVELSGDDATVGTNGALVGTFAAMDQAALDAVATTSDIYLLYNNELVKVNGQSGNSLAANRAYVVYNELVVENPTPAPGRRVRAIPMQEQTATGVENINASEVATKFVENGQIFIRRGNEVFNLQGQVVK